MPISSVSRSSGQAQRLFLARLLDTLGSRVEWALALADRLGKFLARLLVGSELVLVCDVILVELGSLLLRLLVVNGVGTRSLS